MDCGCFVEAEGNGERDTGVEGKMSLNRTLVGMAETRETNLSLLEGD